MNIEQIITKIISFQPTTRAEFDDVKRKVCNKLSINQISNRDLLQAYQNLLKKKRVEPDKILERFMRKADIRTLSGVAVVTSLCKPYNCPGKCIYCPTEARMPKSYLASEPAAARALALQFDPYEQMTRRIEMLRLSGHPTDKIEYIIKGGSWNVYPLKYQYWFILESFRAANNLERSERSLFEASSNALKSDSSVASLLRNLKKEQNYNDKIAKHKIIGLTLETRPDCITPDTIHHMRQMGCTRIELGLQAPDDKILKLVKRGHTVEQFKDAMLLLRQAGFKVDLHFMPDLPGTTAKHDVEMYKSLFTDPGFKPDMVKIYPCTVIKTADLYKWYKQKKYKPYSEKKLFEALIVMKISTPRYCRISRLIRDIPDNEIMGGNMITNLRQNLKKEMAIRGLKCECLRCREVGHSTLPPNHLTTLPPKLFVDKYETTGGTEYFLSYEDKKRQVVYGFLRLRLPNKEKNNSNLSSLLGFSSLSSISFIRELHTYGQLLELGTKNKSASQHKGLGKKLVEEAEKIAKKNRYKKLAVISGVGVRGYYRKLGYKLEKTYMTKNI
ncbi:MAG TPA: tRNA uridine(34) 5-carboxymethylaminomethyl modification radical SAM/GNAT enzyme Elp3 [Candidatus Magasanikbacteria bacterium]|nr:tRNA uridine(34) 5-carboxymethylaminomethyl modification radical SAM/GNAT enzyme Elp3 [Candidatus Magasanikbacteria bacterium]